MSAPQFTPGPWDFACDSYGKVQHSRKACVYTNVREAGGDLLITVAARIANWNDAKLIAAAPELYEALVEARGFIDHCGCLEAAVGLQARIDTALAKARGEQ